MMSSIDPTAGRAQFQRDILIAEEISSLAHSTDQAYHNGNSQRFPHRLSKNALGLAKSSTR